MDAKQITPILNVSDLSQSFDWFSRLGWKKCWDWQATPASPRTFGSVGSGECEIFLCVDGQGGRGGEHGVWMTVWVDRVDAVYDRCRAHDMEILQSPENMPWGVRELHIRHPDGHVLRISAPVRCP